MEMIFCPLYSGSSGNCLFVQYGATRLLIDAGKSGKMIDEALDMIGVDGNTIDAILITHEHIDHISGAGVLCRKHKIPVYATEMTWNAMDAKVGKIPPELRRTFDTFSDFYIGDVGVVPFSIPHDAADPVGYRRGAGDSASRRRRTSAIFRAASATRWRAAPWCCWKATMTPICSATTTTIMSA